MSWSSRYNRLRRGLRDWADLAEVVWNDFKIPLVLIAAFAPLVGMIFWSRRPETQLGEDPPLGVHKLCTEDRNLCRYETSDVVCYAGVFSLSCFPKEVP